jgi:hypothetical protein
MLNEVHKKVFSLAQTTAKLRRKLLLVAAKFPYRSKRFSQKCLNFTLIGLLTHKISQKLSFTI